MIERYAVVAGRIRQELADLEQVVTRVERATSAFSRPGENEDLFVDSAALNLHDFYSGLERVFEQVASAVDRSVPAGHDWHRELLRQMTLDIPQLRPPVISLQTMRTLDEYLRFRHVVRNIYAFELDQARIALLGGRLSPTFEQTRGELLQFADFLDSLTRE